MYICLNHRCKAVFDEADMDERVIDRLHGEYGFIPKCVCPSCGSTEISEAFECSRCGEWFSVDDRHWHPDEEKELCDSCLHAVEQEIEYNPYQGINDMFGLFDAMIGA